MTKLHFLIGKCFFHIHIHYQVLFSLPNQWYWTLPGNFPQFDPNTEEDNSK